MVLDEWQTRDSCTRRNVLIVYFVFGNDCKKGLKKPYGIMIKSSGFAVGDGSAHMGPNDLYRIHDFCMKLLHEFYRSLL